MQASDFEREILFRAHTKTHRGIWVCRVDDCDFESLGHKFGWRGVGWPKVTKYANVCRNTDLNPLEPKVGPGGGKEAASNLNTQLETRVTSFR